MCLYAKKKMTAAWIFHQDNDFKHFSTDKGMNAANKISRFVFMFKDGLCFNILFQLD